MRRAFPALIIFGFALGVFSESFFAFGWPFALLIIIVSVFLYIFSRFKEVGVLAAISVLLFSFGFGILRYEIKDNASVSSELQPIVGQKVLLEGFVSDEPDERENSTRLILKTNDGDKILLVTNRYPEFSYGDILEVSGALKEPDSFSDFDYKAYLAKDDIFLEMVFPEIEKVGSGGGSKIKSALLEIKKKYLSGLARVLPEPNASFIGGLTVGARKSMPSDILENFRKVGVIHIVVLSGYNITIIARAFAGALGSFLPRILSAFFGVAGIILFAILAGASATVIRASIMAAILYLAGSAGRVYQAKIALFAAGFLMILYNPKILRFDLGFQLSFLAALGLIYLSPHFARFVKWLPQRFKIREYGLATLSAQIAVLPLLLQNTNSISLLTLPANLLILIFVPITMFFGALSGVSAWVHPWLAVPFSWVAYFLSSYELMVASFFANIPFSSINF
ncbi:MAG: ComEC family competence protein [Candidatus Niyogibacteria bacterium]|nr:MAG: ComEC family competence protein [Candidatus Niyogibacteria bacterium]